MPSSADLMKQQRMVLVFYKGTVISIQTATENNAALVSLLTMPNSVIELTDLIRLSLDWELKRCLKREWIFAEFYTSNENTQSCNNGD